MFVFDVLKNRFQRGCQTMGYPHDPAPSLPDRHPGALRLDPSKCLPTCNACIPVCPTSAISLPAGSGECPPAPLPPTSSPGRAASPLAADPKPSNPQLPAGRAASPLAADLKPSNPQLSTLNPQLPPTLDLGRCIFCSACLDACPADAITASGDHRMAVRNRQDLLLGAPGSEQIRLATALGDQLRHLFGRSLRLRQVSAGGCNACEADTNVLGTIGWDLGRFGIQFVASPRHADGLLITGPVSRNMELALRKTYDAVPDPKIVIAVGACAIAGGPFAGNPQVLGGADKTLPVDLFIPGCPPHPLTILDGLLRLLGSVST